MTEVQVIALMAAMLYDDNAGTSRESCRQWAVSLAIDLYADAKATVVVADSELRA